MVARHELRISINRSSLGNSAALARINHSRDRSLLVATYEVATNLLSCAG